VSEGNTSIAKMLSSHHATRRLRSLLSTWVCTPGGQFMREQSGEIFPTKDRNGWSNTYLDFKRHHAKQNDHRRFEYVCPTNFDYVIRSTAKHDFILMKARSGSIFDFRIAIELRRSVQKRIEEKYD
jgi:hypothetical protein